MPGFCVGAGNLDLGFRVIGASTLLIDPTLNSLFFLFPFSATWGLSRLCELSDTCDCPLSIVRNRLVTESEALNLCAIIYHALCTAVRGSLQQLTRVCVYMPVA